MFTYIYVLIQQKVQRLRDLGILLVMDVENSTTIYTCTRVSTTQLSKVHQRLVTTFLLIHNSPCQEPPRSPSLASFETPHVFKDFVEFSPTSCYLLLVRLSSSKLLGKYIASWKKGIIIVLLFRRAKNRYNAFIKSSM